MFIIQFDFQFPKGAIKSRRYPRAYCLEVWFQFHKGAIKSRQKPQAYNLSFRRLQFQFARQSYKKIVDVQCYDFTGASTSNLSF